MSSYVRHFEKSKRTDEQNEDERRQKLLRIKNDYYRIRSKYQNTKRALISLKSKIEMQVVRLKSQQESLYTSAVENLGHAVSTGYQTYQLRKSVSRMALSKMFALTSGYTVIAGASYNYAREVDTLVGQFKRHLEEIAELEKELTQVHDLMKKNCPIY